MKKLGMLPPKTEKKKHVVKPYEQMTHAGEEWDWVNDTAVFFCQNGEVKAFKYEVNDSERCFYITRYEKTADEQYIAVPSSSKEIID